MDLQPPSRRPRPRPSYCPPRKKEPALDPASFPAKHFTPDQAAIASRLRELLIQHLPFDLARLHPDDRLVEDLRMDALDSMSTVEFILSVEKNFSIKLPEAEVALILTLRDLTTCVARLTLEHPPA